MRKPKEPSFYETVAMLVANGKPFDIAVAYASAKAVHEIMTTPLYRDRCQRFPLRSFVSDVKAAR